MAQSDQIPVGNVVRNKLTDAEMAVVWIVGQQQSSTSPMDFNAVYRMSGFQDSDIVYGYFAEREYKVNLLKIGQVEKIYE